MPHRTPDVLVHSQQHQIALSRWDNEGGAGPSEEMGGVFAAGRGRVERRRRLTRGPIEFGDSRLADERDGLDDAN
jgi:hypothetical protein